MLCCLRFRVQLLTFAVLSLSGALGGRKSEPIQENLRQTQASVSGPCLGVDQGAGV